MRCQYVEVPSALPGTFVCFKCKNCGWRLSLEGAGTNMEECAAKLPPCSRPPGIGVGARLKRLLRRLSIELPENCACNARIEIMDSNGPVWCRDRRREIVGWMREGAELKNIQFVPFAARAILDRAIIATRRSQERRGGGQ